MKMALPYLSFLLLLLACGTATKNVAPVAQPLTSTIDQSLDTAAVYHTAIADYIKAMGTRDGSFPDTVFIGEHEELPDIELPAVIEQVSVRIVAPAEAESLKSGKRFAYLNVFGWFTPGQVEFYVVRFQQGMRHWPDGRDDRHLYYRVGAEQSVWVLDSLRP